MPHFQVFEGERFIVRYDLEYHGENWSDASDQGNKVVEGDTTTTYFTVKDKDNGVVIFALTSADAAEIEWITANPGELQVKFPVTTEGNVGIKLPYELRIKFTDGSFNTVDSGTLDILESTVDTP